MARSKGTTRALVSSAMLLVVCALALGVAGPARAADDSMKMIPGDCLFCVRINNLNGALGQVDMFLAGLFPMGVSMPVKAQMGQMLGSADPKGIDMAGSFAVFGPLPGGDAPDPSRIGVLIPVSDYQQFVGGGNLNVSEPDASGISKIGPAGGQILAVTQVGSYALATTLGNEQALIQAKKLLAGSTSGLAASLDAAELKRATDAPVWAYGNIQLAGKMFGPMVQGKIQEAKSMFQATEAQGQRAMASAGAALDMYSAMLDSLMKETKFISLSLEPSGDKIGAGFVVAAMPGTGMADMLKGAATKPDNKLLGYLQNGAAMNFTGTMSSPFWLKVNQAYIDLLPKLLGNDASADDMQRLKKMVTDSCEALGGSIAGSFSVDAKSKPPFQVKYAAELKDAAKFYQVMDGASKMMSEGPIADFYEKMGMKMSFDLKRKAETYKGVSVDEIKFTMEPTDANAPEMQMVTAMYGGGLNIRLATVDNLLLYAFAQDSASMVHELIDQAKAGGPKQVPSEVQAAMQLIPGADKADFFVSCNVLRMAQMMNAMTPMQIPPSMPTQGNLAVAGNVGDGKMTVNVAVPKQHVMEVMGLVMQMQMQQMQQKQPSDTGGQS